MTWTRFFNCVLNWMTTGLWIGVGVILLALFFTLPGCAAQRVVVQKVEVPVAMQVPCPAPSVPARPHLPIADLAPGSSPAQIDRALVATVATLQGYAAQLEQLLGVQR